MSDQGSAAGAIESLHILGSREFGGADQFYVRLVRALAEAGQPVTAINRPDSPVAEALRGGPVPQVHVPLANQWDFWSRWKIGREIARRGPCVVQTYMGRATRLTRVPAKSPAVHVARLGGFYKIDGYYRHADAWVGNTRAICDYLVKAGLRADRVHHIGNFVPPAGGVGPEEKARLRREHRLPEDAWLLFALGRLVPKKGFKALLSALSLLPREVGGRQVVLMIAGDGPEAAGLRAWATERGVQERVRWLGWQNPPDAFYGLADAFVCPSRHEPLGNVILEAWNHGCPVISTRNEGASELITEGETGLLCDYGDHAGMARVIERMLTASTATRAGLARAGNAHLQRHFSQKTIVDAYLGLYRNLLASKG
jgi:glycosyltransferase involved in cell wall biosynthesis